LAKDFFLLDDAGVDVVILHKGFDTSFESTVRGKLGAPFYEDDRIALFNVPKPTASILRGQAAEFGCAKGPTASLRRWRTKTGRPLTSRMFGACEF
jgi:hypothetical protein